MKSFFSACLVSAMLVASAGVASATSYLQASSTEEQLATDTKPKVVTMNSTDASKNIKQEKGVVTVMNPGLLLYCGAQVGGKGKGLGPDVDEDQRQGCRQLQHRAAHPRPDLHRRAGLPRRGGSEAGRQDHGGIFRIGSRRRTGGQEAAGEPVVPSIILSGWRID